MTNLIFMYDKISLLDMVLSTLQFRINVLGFSKTEGATFFPGGLFILDYRVIIK